MLRARNEGRKEHLDSGRGTAQYFDATGEAARRHAHFRCEVPCHRLQRNGYALGGPDRLLVGAQAVNCWRRWSPFWRKSIETV